MRLFFAHDIAELELANCNTAVRSVEMSVATSAGLKFQHLRWFIQRPNARKGDVQMLHYELSAFLKHRRKFGCSVQSQCDFIAECRGADTLVERFFRARPLFDFAAQIVVRLAQRVFGLFALSDVSD